MLFAFSLLLGWILPKGLGYIGHQLKGFLLGLGSSKTTRNTTDDVTSDGNLGTQRSTCGYTTCNGKDVALEAMPQRAETRSLRSRLLLLLSALGVLLRTKLPVGLCHRFPFRRTFRMLVTYQPLRVLGYRIRLFSRVHYGQSARRLDPEDLLQHPLGAS